MTKGELTEVVGDVTNPQLTAENEVPMIPHCCNNLGVMGAGVALALKKKWSGVEVYYKKSAMALGSISFWMEFSDEEIPPERVPTVCVFNMIGQDGLRGSGAQRQSTAPARRSGTARPVHATGTHRTRRLLRLRASGRDTPPEGRCSRRRPRQSGSLAWRHRAGRRRCSGYRGAPAARSVRTATRPAGVAVGPAAGEGRAG